MEITSIHEANCLIRQADRLLTDGLDLTATQLEVLHVVQAAQPTEVSCGFIAKKLDVTPAVVTGLIDRLEKRKLLSREASATGDRRAIGIRITQDGQARLVRARDVLRAA